MASWFDAIGKEVSTDTDLFVQGLNLYNPFDSGARHRSQESLKGSLNKLAASDNSFYRGVGTVSEFVAPTSDVQAALNIALAVAPGLKGISAAGKGAALAGERIAGGAATDIAAQAGERAYLRVLAQGGEHEAAVLASRAAAREAAQKTGGLFAEAAAKDAKAGSGIVKRLTGRSKAGTNLLKAEEKVGAEAAVARAGSEAAVAGESAAVAETRAASRLAGRESADLAAQQEAKALASRGTRLKFTGRAATNANRFLGAAAVFGLASEFTQAFAPPTTQSDTSTDNSTPDGTDTPTPDPTPDTPTPDPYVADPSTPDPSTPDPSGGGGGNDNPNPYGPPDFGGGVADGGSLDGGAVGAEGGGGGAGALVLGGLLIGGAALYMRKRSKAKKGASTPASKPSAPSAASV